MTFSSRRKRPTTLRANAAKTATDAVAFVRSCRGAALALGLSAAWLGATPAAAQNPFYYNSGRNDSPAVMDPRGGYSPNHGAAPYYQPAPGASAARPGRGYAVRPVADDAIPTFTPAPDATPITISSNRAPSLGPGGQPAPAGVHKMSPEALARARAGVSAAAPATPAVKPAPTATGEGPALVAPGVVRTSAASPAPFGVRQAQYEAPAARSARKVIRSQPMPGAVAPMSEDDLPMLESVPVDPNRGAPEDEAPDPSSVETDRPKRPFNCPSPADYKKIGEIDDDIAATGELFPEECGLGDDAFLARSFSPLTYEWKASALCHKPLYFEEVALERYGHSRFPILQPVISGAFFLGTIPVLPYKMGLERPGECIYALGYYRPGSCAPYLRYRVPVTPQAVAFEAAAVAGLIAFLP